MKTITTVMHEVDHDEVAEALSMFLSNRVGRSVIVHGEDIPRQSYATPYSTEDSFMTVVEKQECVVA